MPKRVAASSRSSGGNGKLPPASLETLRHGGKAGGEPVFKKWRCSHLRVRSMTMTVTRRELIAGGIAAGAAAVVRPSLAGLLSAKGIPVKMGATDWNLRQEASLSSLELGKRIGFEGVQVSLTDRRNREAPPRVKNLAEAAAHREEARKQGVHISSTCLNILHV